LLAIALLLVVAPIPSQGDRIPVPVTEAVFPPSARLMYAGESFVFNTTVKLSVTFEFRLPNEIHLKVRVGVPLQTLSSTVVQNVQIYWEEGNEDLYNGIPPEGEWTGVILTEGGMTEK